MALSDDSGAKLYLTFADLFNRRDYERLDEVLTEDFTDHHPGLVDVASRDIYRRNLSAVISALDMSAEPEDVIGVGDRVYTRIKLTGRHVGSFLGLEPTDAELTWYTHEIWRVQDDRFVERWAVDDLLTLLGQMGYPLPGWTDPE
jgi:predicted ester cyclase